MRPFAGRPAGARALRGREVWGPYAGREARASALRGARSGREGLPRASGSSGGLPGAATLEGLMLDGLLSGPLAGESRQDALQPGGPRPTRAGFRGRRPLREGSHGGVFAPLKILVAIGVAKLAP